MDASMNKTNLSRLGSAGRKGVSVSQLWGAPRKEDWIQLYTGRILRAWLHRETPLGLAWTYANWIHRSLSGFYEQPLTKAFIERTYQITSKRDV